MNPISPMHYSNANGFHRDVHVEGLRGHGHQTVNPGQTVLPQFDIGGNRGYAADQQCFRVNNPGVQPPMLPY